VICDAASQQCFLDLCSSRNAEVRSNTLQILTIATDSRLVPVDLWSRSSLDSIVSLARDENTIVAALAQELLDKLETQLEISEKLLELLWNRLLEESQSAQGRWSVFIFMKLLFLGKKIYIYFVLEKDFLLRNFY
jgi:hypothetical protein